MGEASYEARKRPLESDLPEQIEVRVRRERRRRWTTSDKLRIVEEAFAPGAVAKRVAERHEISTGLLFFCSLVTDGVLLGDASRHRLSD